MLAPALRPLNAAIAPDEFLVDTGGDGRCCFSSLALGLQLLELFDGDRDAVRRFIVAHASRLVACNATMQRGSRPDQLMSVADYLTACFLSWPAEARRNRPENHESWLELMAHENCWGDEGTLAMAADAFDVEVAYRAVHSDGSSDRGGLIVPRVPSRAKARVTLVLWVSQHYVLAVRALDADPSRRAGDVLVPNSAFDMALVPTASQLQAIFERSAQMAALHAVGATDSDTPALATALANDASTNQGEFFRLAVSESVEDARAGEQRDLQNALHSSRSADANGAPHTSASTSSTKSVSFAPSTSAGDKANGRVGGAGKAKGRVGGAGKGAKRAWPGGNLRIGDAVSCFNALIARRRARGESLSLHQRALHEALQRRDTPLARREDAKLLAALESRWQQNRRDGVRSVGEVRPPAAAPMAASSLVEAGSAGAEAGVASAGRQGVVVGAAESVSFRTPAEPVAALQSAPPAIDLTGGATHAADAPDPAAETIGGADGSGGPLSAAAPAMAGEVAVDAAEAVAPAAPEAAAEATTDAAEADDAGAEAMDVDSGEVAVEAPTPPSEPLTARAARSGLAGGASLAPSAATADPHLRAPAASRSATAEAAFRALVHHRREGGLALSSLQQATWAALERLHGGTPEPQDEVLLSHMVSRLPELLGGLPEDASMQAEPDLPDLVPPELGDLAEADDELEAASAGLGEGPRARAARPRPESSFSYPLRTAAEVRRLLASPEAPTILVAMEFSGSLRTALEAAGFVTISADFRECEIGGMHFQGDVREVVGLVRWKAIYFFPNCYQQLRADQDCLPLKIHDGRAFWGCAVVIWCLCCASTDVAIVEQPDTIVYDFHTPGGVMLHEFRTSYFGDLSDKFIRLGVRGLSDTPLDGRSEQERRKRRRPDGRAPLTSHADAEARDRARSSWAHHPKTCVVLTDLLARPRVVAPALDYGHEIALFALAWVRAGYGLPAGFDSADARPPTQAEREYQLQRGPGHGRGVTPASTVDPRARAGLASAQAFTSAGADGDEYGYDDDLSSDDEAGAGCAAPMLLASPAELTPARLFADGLPTLDVRRAGELASLMLFICVVGQPLVFAHVNGFSIIGFEAPSRLARPACMLLIQRLVDLVVGALCYAFMVGEYKRGARLFTAPIGARPDPATIVRTPAARRQACAARMGFVWCTLAALQGTAVEDAAARAVLSASAFIGPTEQLADTPLSSTPDASSFSFGSTPASLLIRRPLVVGEDGPPAATALASLLQADRWLASALEASSDARLEGWRQRIAPLNVDDVPAGLVEQLPSFDDSRLDGLALSPVPDPVSTSWLPLPPPQLPVEGHCPRHVGDLMPEETRKRLYDWFQHNLEDMVRIRNALAVGLDPATLFRDRPAALAIGQSELFDWARGRVWDCRPATKDEHSGCCQVLDFHAPFETHLDLEVFRRRLHRYPDQTLLANLLDGVRLDADVELQAVLIPHLASLPLGFASVEKELRRLKGKGWYDFFADMPFYPMYFNGQGATARKLEPDRFRRTTEGGGPRYAVYDLSGLRALSINEASHIWHMPQHFLHDDRPEMKAWLRARGLPASEEALCNAPPSKWPGERKPTLCEVMRDIAILRRAAERLGLPIYIFGDDAKDFFNQLAMSTSELHKLGIVFLAHEGELDESDLLPHSAEAEGVRLVFVSEKRLGFGTHGASNIAQRFSNALLDLYRDDLDDAEAVAQQDASPELRAWLDEREAVQQASGVPCHETRRFEDLSSTNMRPHRVCSQQRLYSVWAYCDDPIFIVVGAERTLRALRVWRELVQSIGLIMAIEEKRSLGTWACWLGVLIIPALGLVVIPRDKLLRASACISRVLEDTVEFHEYRALCGLLEFFRAVNLHGRNVMHGLYQPHGPEGASRHGPAGRVVCSPLMRKQLQRWLRLVSRACGTSVKRSLWRTELDPSPSLRFHLCSDAMYEPEEAGIGGFCHGFFWNFAVPVEWLSCLSIPILEFLGVVFNILAFYPMLGGLLEGDDSMRVVLRTDALTAALTLPEESQRSELLVQAYQWLRERVEFQQLAPRLEIAHLYGDANPFSDRLSRHKMDEFRRLCLQFAIKPISVELPPSCAEVFELVAESAHRRRLHAGCSAGPRGLLQRRFGSAATAAPPVPRATPSTESASSGLLQRRFGAAAAAVASPLPAAANSPTAGAVPGATAAVSLPSVRAALDTTAARIRRVGNLAVPRAPPARLTASRVAEAGRKYAQLRVQALAQGDGDMALRAGVVEQMAMGEALHETIDYGVNASTAQKDERAWLFWETVCESQGTSPLRTADDVRQHPEKQSHLLSVLLLYAFAICVPKDRSRHFVKPRSALAYPLAIIRVFGRWGIVMPGYKALLASLNGLLRLYIAYHGPHSLAPKRAEPMKFSMMRDIFGVGAAGPVKVGKWQWSDAMHDVFIFRRLNCFLMFTAFRLGEIVSHPSGEIMFITRACLFWCIAGVIIVNPTAAQLMALRPGVDYACVQPPRSKPDQWGEIHCPFPVILTYGTEAANPAACLRDIELAAPCQGAERETRPLFADASGQPYTHHYLNLMLTAILTYLYGPLVAALYTFHSYRSGLATALHAAGVSDSMIQLICRWMCPESLHVYRRMGTREHERHITVASGMNVDVMQATNYPRISNDEGYGNIVAGLQGPRGRDAQRDYEAAMATIRQAPPQRAAAVTPRPPPRPRATPTPTPARAAAPAPPPTPVAPSQPPSTAAITGRPARGTRVFVQRHLWPTYECHEHAGEGWAATVESTTAHTCVVSFDFACAPNGSAFEPERLATEALLLLL